MSIKEDNIDNQRRHFLRNSVLVGAGTVAAGSLHAAETPTAEVKKSDAKQEGYRLTKHIQDYYKSAKS